MENKQYQEIETIVKALDDDLKPVFEEVKALTTAIGELGDDKSSHPLAQLTLRLTKTARRHNIDEKVKVGEREVVVGTNHQGLGIEHDYSSQLSPVVSEGYYRNAESEEQQSRDILFDSDAVIDLTSIIKKSSQKTFLKMVKILKKHNLNKAFKTFKNEEVNGIEVKGNGNYTIKLNINRHNTDFRIVDSEGHEISEFEVYNEDGKPDMKPDDEEKDALKQISGDSWGRRTNLTNIKSGFLISQNKEAITEALKSKRTLLKGITASYKKESKELNELLQPLLALEKL